MKKRKISCRKRQVRRANDHTNPHLKKGLGLWIPLMEFTSQFSIKNQNKL